ncbi:MAG: PucR family transcriptional regulator ligand-binding domain-containing protein [Mycobacterium sp.]
MAITVRRLAGRKDLGLTLVAGPENADRAISWAHAIELADPTPYLSGGELVMTTGLKMGATNDEQYEYVARLSTAGVVALAFDTGTNFDRVPDGVLSAGDALGLPILQVPADTPFIAITRAVIDELTADQLRSVQCVVDQQEIFVRATLRNGVPGVVAALSQALSATAVVIGTDGRPLAAAGRDTEHVIAITAEAARNMRPHSGRRHASRVIADGAGYCTIQTVRAAQTARGYLAVRSEVALSAPDRLLVAHALSLISIELEKPAKVIDAEQRLRTAVALALLGEPRSTDPGVLRYFGFDPDGDVVVVVLTNAGALLPAEAHVTEKLGGGDVPYLMCSINDEIVIILPGEHARMGRDIHRRLGAQLERQLGGGQSSPASFGDLDFGLNQARAAARANADGRFSEFDHFDVLGVLLGIRDRGELELLAHSLNPLDSDAADRTLLDTLEAFLSCNGQVETAATKLNIHRHTMRNRLRRIGELTGCDLQSADTRAAMWLAIKARELLAVSAHRSR